MRYQCRYSSSEMLYLEVTETEVRCYLDHSPQSANRWSFEQVAAGELEKDAEVRTLFSAEEIEAVKTEARKRTARESEYEGV